VNVAIFKTIFQTVFFASVFCFYCHTASATLAEDYQRGANALQAMAPDVHEKIIQVPTENTPPVLLQVTVYTPAGSGPFPLVIMNHGSADLPPQQQSRSRLSLATLYFLSRGYAVAQPMMRSYAGSGGLQPAVGCDIIATSEGNALDIGRVIQYMSKQPDIDGSRVIVAGQSYGGYNTLAVGTLNLPSVKGLINFNGTMLTKVCPDDLNRTINAVGYYAARTHIPSIWFYGTNDKLIAESTWRATYRRYTLLGGDATLISVGNFKEDSHNLLGHVESIAIIAPHIDAFLHKIGLPNAIKYPGYVPSATPPSSHFADINDVSAVPISDKEKPEYLKFLTMPLPRAFFIDENDGITAISGGLNPEDKGTEMCVQRHVRCWPFAVDNQVVWIRPATLTPTPPPSNYADISDIQAVPLKGAQANEAYQNFLKMPLPRVFVIATDDKLYSTQGGLDPLGLILKLCQNKMEVCTPYAVDNQVVWSPTAEFLKPTDFADIHDFEAVPYVKAVDRKMYQKFLKLKNPRAFVIAPDGTSTMASGDSQSLQTALSKCQSSHHRCAAYALNDDVVWIAH
jgi:dienelactone hydrolase